MLVIKLGGSILKEEAKVIALIIKEYQKHQKLIIVTSAIGRYPDPYSTDTLNFLASAVSADEKTQILACGEIISAIHLVSLLKTNQIDAIYQSVYDIGLEYDNTLSLKKAIDFQGHDIVVVPGFMAIKDEKLFLLGRGSSNLTAVFLANYHQSNLLIVSDTDGLYSRLPHDKDAYKLPLIDLSQLVLLMIEAPRLFPFSIIKYLKQDNLVIYYRNLENENGSLIGNFAKNSLLF